MKVLNQGQALLPPTHPGNRSAFDNKLLLWLVFAFWLYALFPFSEFQDVAWRLRLGDSDNEMRLVQVRDLLAGQSWFDMTQHRLMPPTGTSMHWSRLVDAPLAVLIGLVSPWLGVPLAEGLVAALWPPALFGAYLFLVYRTIRSRFGVRAAMLSLFAATQAVGLGGLFAFGRIDHHNIQVILILALGLCLASPGSSPLKAAFGGASAAVSLAVGLEALPFIAIAGVFLLGDWVLNGRPALASFCGFALALAGVSLVLFAIQTNPSLWLVSQCDALSPPWLWLASAGGVLAVGAAWLNARLDHRGHRTALTGFIGAVAISGFALLAPRCLSGPFQGLSPVVRAEWLDVVREMQPFYRLLAAMPGVAMAYVAPLGLAGMVATYIAWRGRPDLRRAATFAALFLLTGFVLSQFQLRGIYVAVGFLPLVAGPLFDHAITLMRQPISAWQRGSATMLLAILMCGQVWAALIAPLSGELEAASLASLGDRDCRAAGSVAVLNTLTSGTILADLDLGPSILLNTGHKVVAAPYHRAIAGLTASVEGLRGDEATLKRALATSSATYLAVCTNQDASKTLVPEPFAHQLIMGKAMASWLERLPLPDTALAVWRVHLAE